MPPDLQRALGVLFFVVAVLLVGMLLFNEYGCVPGAAAPAAYQAELVGCNQNSKTLAESVECENKVRKAYGRPLRDAGVDQ